MTFSWLLLVFVSLFAGVSQSWFLTGEQGGRITAKLLNETKSLTQCSLVNPVVSLVGTPDRNQYRHTSPAMAILDSDSVENPNNMTMILVWQNSWDQSGRGISGQLFQHTAAGQWVPLRSAFSVNAVTEFDQQAPKVAALENGKFVVVWQSTVALNQEGFQNREDRIIAQLFDWSGMKLGREFHVASIQTNNTREEEKSMIPNLSWYEISRQESKPAVVPNSGGDGFIVTWIMSPLTSTGTIASVLVNQTNSSVSSSFSPALPTMNPASGQTYLMSRTFTSDGHPNTLPMQINALNDQAGPSQSLVAMHNGGRLKSRNPSEFLAVWTSTPVYGATTASTTACSLSMIYAAFLDSMGKPKGAMFPVSTWDTVKQTDPQAVTLRRADRMVVAWTATQSSLSGGTLSSSEIRAQIMLKDGTRVGGVFSISAPLMGINTGVMLTALEMGGGGFIAFWNHLNSTTGLFQVYARVFSLDGRADALPFLVNGNETDVVESNFMPAAITTPSNEVLCAWSDTASILGRTIPCVRDCVLSAWSEWSPCSPNCGQTNSTQFRNRSILVEPSMHGKQCQGDLFQERFCPIPDPSDCPPDPLCVPCANGICYQRLTPMNTTELTPDTTTINYTLAIQICSELSACPSGDEQCVAVMDDWNERTFAVTQILSNVPNINEHTWVRYPLSGMVTMTMNNEALDLNTSPCFSISHFGAVMVQACGNQLPAVLCQYPEPSQCR